MEGDECRGRVTCCAGYDCSAAGEKTFSRLGLNQQVIFGSSFPWATEKM